MDCTYWFYLCLSLCGVILAMLAMFFNYSLRLDARTVKLEKKNGHEQEQINRLQEKVQELENKLKNHGKMSVMSEKKANA